MRQGALSEARSSATGRPSCRAAISGSLITGAGPSLAWQSPVHFTVPTAASQRAGRRVFAKRRSFSPSLLPRSAFSHPFEGPLSVHQADSSHTPAPLWSRLLGQALI